jgi:hypothetical protein
MRLLGLETEPETEADMEPAPGTEPTGEPAPGSLLDPGWKKRLSHWEGRHRGKRLAVVVDTGFWQLMKDKLGARLAEVGGVAVMERSGETAVIIGAVFPEQVTATGVHCEFPVAEVSRVRDAIEKVLGPGAPGNDTSLVITWVHTHPGMGVFLSGTDRATSATWRTLDPKFTPIVIDPLFKKVGVFGVDNRPIGPLDFVGGLVHAATADRLRAELASVYRDAGMRRAMVLIPGVQGKQTATGKQPPQTPDDTEATHADGDGTGASAE